MHAWTEYFKFFHRKSKKYIMVHVYAWTAYFKFHSWRSNAWSGLSSVTQHEYTESQELNNSFWFWMMKREHCDCRKRWGKIQDWHRNSQVGNIAHYHHQHGHQIHRSNLSLLSSSTTSNGISSSSNYPEQWINILQDRSTE